MRTSLKRTFTFSKFLNSLEIDIYVSIEITCYIFLVLRFLGAICRLAWRILFQYSVPRGSASRWAVFCLAVARGIISVNSRQIVHASFGIWH